MIVYYVQLPGRPMAINFDLELKFDPSIPEMKLFWNLSLVLRTKS